MHIVPLGDEQMFEKKKRIISVRYVVVTYAVKRVPVWWRGYKEFSLEIYAGFDLIVRKCLRNYKTVLENLTKRAKAHRFKD